MSPEENFECRGSQPYPAVRCFLEIRSQVLTLLKLVLQSQCYYLPDLLEDFL